tara:strand:+ start:3214 stop:4668 length:1455 start_codon:yes stop_codon:yes gene_type:complete
MSLTDYTINDAPMLMDIRSETLEPISNTSRKFVFRLDQAGYLDQNSLLLFKPQSVANNGNKRVNSFNGGLGAIKRATLSVGDFVINDIDGADKMMTLSNFVSKNDGVRNNLDCWYYQNQLFYKVLTGADTEYSGGGDIVGNGTIVMDKRKSGLNTGDQNNNNNACGLNSCIILQNADLNIQIGIPLGTIFPALKGRTLPLFLFQDYRILITIEFNDATEYVNDIAQVPAGGAANVALLATAGSVNYTDVKLQVDYLIMPAEVQNKDRAMTNQQGGLNLTFLDAVKVQKQIPVQAVGVKQEVEHRIGADNKEVHKIYMVKKLTEHDLLNSVKIFGQQRIDAINQEEYNVNIAGVDVFPDFKKFPNQHYDETSNCLGSDIQVPRPIYYNDENTACNGLGADAHGTLGRYKPLCLDLTNGNPGILGAGRTIGAYPIIWKYRRLGASATANIYGTRLHGAMNVDYYLLVSKTANIRSTPQGTNVMVSY